MPHKSSVTYKNQTGIYDRKIVRKKSQQRSVKFIISFPPSLYYRRVPLNSISILFLSIMILLIGNNNATIPNSVDPTFSAVSNSSSKTHALNSFISDPLWSSNGSNYDYNSNFTSKDTRSHNDSLNYDYYYESLLNSFDFNDSIEQEKNLDSKQESNFTQNPSNSSHPATNLDVNEPIFPKVETKMFNFSSSITNSSTPMSTAYPIMMPYSKIESMSPSTLLTTGSELTTSTSETTKNYRAKVSHSTYSHPKKISFESIYRDRLMMDLGDPAESHRKRPQKKALNIYFTLHNVCSNKNVQVFGQKVNAKASNQPKTIKFAKFVFETISTDNKAVRIKNAYTGRYICYDRQGRIIATALLKRRGLCDFTQIYGNHHFKYRSAYQPTWYLGFDPKGNPIMDRVIEQSNDLNNGFGHDRNYDKCFRFSKRTCASPPTSKSSSTYVAHKSHSPSLLYDKPIFNKIFNRSPAILQKWSRFNMPPRLFNYTPAIKTVKTEQSNSASMPLFIRNYLWEEARRDALDDLEDNEYADY